MAQTVVGMGSAVSHVARVVCALALAGCSSTSSTDATPPGGGPDAPATGACPAGFARDEATGACLDVLPQGECAAGTGPFLGEASCRPVGWTTCAAPFEPDPSGWGCRPVIAASCPAGTTSRLGSATCVPVGDCAGAFPPADARLFVDASLDTVDATHFKHVFDAALAAHPGDVIAVMPGHYVEDVDVTDANVSIVGKCPAEVVIENPGDKRAGILVNGVKGVTVRGVTLRGHYSGVLVKGGGDATVEDVIVEKSRYLGVYAAEKGSRLRVVRSHVDDVVADAGKFGWGAAAQLGGAIDLEDVTIDAPTSNGIVIGGMGSKGTLARVVVRDVRSTDGSGMALGVVDGANATVDGALFEGGLARVGLSIDVGSLDVKHMVLRGTTGDREMGTGRNVQVGKGATFTLAESVVAEGEGGGNVVVLDAGTNVTITDSTIRGPIGGDGSRGDSGIFAGTGSTLTVKRSAIVANVDTGIVAQDPDTHVTVEGTLVAGTLPLRGGSHGGLLGFGVTTSWGATLAMSDSSLVKNHATGIVVQKPDDATGAIPRATFTKTLVMGTQPIESGLFGRGIQVDSGGVASMDGCAVVENSEVSLLVGGEGSELSVKQSLVRDTRMPSGRYGDGAVADGGGKLGLDGAWLLGHPGVGIVVAGASATVTRSLVARSTIGIAVQAGTSLETGDAIPASPAALACFVTNDTRFVDNETRVGSGLVPLPDALETPGRASK